MIRHSAMALTALLVGLIFWAPLPFGGVTSWAEDSLEILAFCAAALAMLAVARGQDLRFVAWPAAAVGAVACLGLLQTVPVPEKLVELLSPAQARLHQQAVGLAKRQAAALAAGDEPGAGSDLGAVPTAAACFSVAPPATRVTAFSWLAAAACLVAGAAVGRRRFRRRWLAAAISLSAIVQVFIGARAANSGQRTLWGVEVPITAARLRGTFFNPNHLAMYLEIGLAVAFAWGWWALRRGRGELPLDRRILSFVPPAMIWLTLFAGVVFTASRGGLTAVLACLVVQGMLLAGVQRRMAPLVIIVALVGAGLAAALALGLQAGPARMLATQAYDVSFGARWQAWSATVDLWRRFPLAGAGLGTFRDAFTLVQPAALAGTWRHAHNGPLELLATTGLLGPLILLAGLAAVLARLFAVLRSGRRSEDQAAGLAGLGALAAIAVHECFDFGLTMPANALTLAIVIGAAVSARLGAAVPAGAAASRPLAPTAAARQADRSGQHGAAGDPDHLQQVQPRR